MNLIQIYGLQKKLDHEITLNQTTHSQLRFWSTMIWMEIQSVLSTHPLIICLKYHCRKEMVLLNKSMEIGYVLASDIVRVHINLYTNIKFVYYICN